MGKNRQKVLFLILAILLAVYLIDQGVFSGGGSESGSLDDRQASQIMEADLRRSVEADRASYQDADRLKTFQYDGDWASDPFYYLTAEELDAQNNGLITSIFGLDGSQPAIELTAISLRGTRGMAIINDEIVTEGDRIAGFVVDQIESNFVILKKGNQPLRINLEN